ncbi:MAG: hypothetical protein ACLQF1_18480 [Methyloceanibacter sp.]
MKSFTRFPCELAAVAQPPAAAAEPLPLPEPAPEPPVVPEPPRVRKLLTIPGAKEALARRGLGTTEVVTTIQRRAR